MNEYKLQTDNTNLALSTAEVNEHLKTSFTDVTTEVLISAMIKAVEQFGEGYTKRTFLNKTFRLFLDCWPSIYVELDRSPLVSITSVKYYDTDGVLQTVDAGDYYKTFSHAYSRLVWNDSFVAPTLRSRMQQIEIDFVAGYGATSADLPQALKLAMLNHLALLWENRGDCDTATLKGDVSFFYKNLPNTSRILYSHYTILEIDI